MGKFLPERLADQVLRRSMQHALSRRIDIGEDPVTVEREETVIDAGEDGFRALLGHQRLIAQLVFDLHGLAAQGRHFDVGANARQQFPRTEGLAEIVVCAGIEPLELGLLTGPCRQQNHWHIPQFAVIAQCLQQTEPVEPRHHDVAQHQMRAPAPCGFQCGLPVGDGFDLVKFAQ